MNSRLTAAFWVLLGCPLAALALGLMPRDEGKAAWEALQRQVLSALGGSCAAVKQPVERVSAASTADSDRDGLPLNKMVSAELRTMDRVKYVLGPEKKQGKPQDAGGLLAVTPTVTGTYVLGTVSRAWIDMVDHEMKSFARARHYEWVDFCGRRMKVGIFELRAGARYWIQMSASPDPVLDLFVAGPLRGVDWHMLRPMPQYMNRHKLLGDSYGFRTSRPSVQERPQPGPAHSARIRVAGR